MCSIVQISGEMEHMVAGGPFLVVEIACGAIRELALTLEKKDLNCRTSQYKLLYLRV